MYKAVKAAGRIGEFVQQDEKTLMQLGCRASEKRRQDDHPAGYGTPSYHDWRGHGKPADGTGKDNFLYR